ncbi:MAG TPA: DUF4149 domain-containing protein [Candidatus Acidoferrales bacterium]|nr:DUF4149 domain-containing protein [Candidatus Acidoferrales bacterium]
MTTFFRYLQFLALALWVGAIVYLSFVVAPALFATVTSADQAGAVIGIVLGRLHWMGVWAGVVYLAAALARWRSVAALARPGALAVLLMVMLTLISQRGVFPRIAALGAQMGSIERTPASSPLRRQFNHLHQVSVEIETAVLLLGLAALFFTVRDPQR